MYLEYSKLWSLLQARGLSKSDLIEQTGISSRVMAKLSKNQTVTTDTIARICAALGCDVGDIVTCVSEYNLSLYGYYRKYGEVYEKTALYRKICFAAAGHTYVVYLSNRAATRRTTVHCRPDGTVVWEEEYPNGVVADTREQHVLVKPIPAKGEITVVVIRGKPASITGLDDGVTVSADGLQRGRGTLCVMSEAAFRAFIPRWE